MKPVLWPAIALTLLCSSTSAADPIRVTSGTIQFTDEPGIFDIAGSGFQLTLDEWFPTLLSGPFWFDHCSFDFQCLPGSTIDFTATYGFAGFADLGVVGGTVNGVRYPALFPVGTLAFQGPDLTIPSRLDAGEITEVPLRGPFGFQGDVSVFADEARTGPAVFTGKLTGRGTAEGSGLSDGQGVTFSQLVYSFESPVPEPSTLLLLISGTITRAMMRHRRGRD
jgi:hypothetical protein